MSQINRAFMLLRRTLLVAVLVGLISLIALPTTSVRALPFFGDSNQVEDMNKTGNRPFGERESVNILQADKSNDVDKATIKKIQDKAGDKVGDRAVGDTGLKNIRELGKNIPENVDRMAKQASGGKSPSDLANDVQNKVNGAASDAKQAVKNNLR